MKHLKRTLLTLVALLAVTTGAWAAGSDALAGVFTINASGDKVQFSKGNLQAVFSAAGTDCTWQFAENQWDCSGADNNKVNGNGSVSSNCTIDVFGWSTSSNNFGIHNSKTDGDYSGDFVDWGTAIGSGWRTLTHDEWNFLLQSRTTTSGLLFAKANLFGTVHGLILFPDNYTHPDGLAAITAPNDATGNAGWNGNQYTAEEWAKMEAAGAVFLPAAGCREGTANYNLNVIGYYHTATPADANNSYDMAFHASALAFDYNQPNHWAFSVRLVRKPTTATTVPLTWTEATKTATLTNGMPAGNVTVSVEYFPQAEFAMSTDATLAPTAIANVPANTDAPIVKAGTVANIGTSEVKQGTLMYFVSQPDGDAEPVAPTYDTKGWTDKVPTADGLQEGNAYVWYYIKGAEPANIADRTDDNTRSDSDIMPLGTSGFVTLAAEPTYTVSLNKTDLAAGEPAKWSAKSTNVTTAVNLGEADLEGVKKGETVTVTYSGSKKVIGMKAEKKKAPAETTVTLTTGEIGDLFSWDSNSKTINGITIAVSGDACFHSTGLIDVHGDTGPEPDPDQVYAVGTFTFTSSAGKIKRIDINHNNGGLWYGAGEGWPGSYQVYDNSTFTWSGIPAASVTLNGSHKGFENCALSDVSSIVFTLEPTN
jgi:hypothetical protein